MTSHPKRSALYGRMVETRVCALSSCEKVFFVRPAWKGQRFCSRSCSGRNRRVLQHIVPCANCKVEFDSRGKLKYCSYSCRSAAREKNRLQYACLGPSCENDTGNHKRLYCSEACRIAGRKEIWTQKEKSAPAPQGRRYHLATPQDIALHRRAMEIGTYLAGKEFGITKSAVNGRLFRAQLSTKGAPGRKNNAKAI